MPYPRSHLVDPHAPGAYHCVSRCVRRAFLCGQDKETGQDFEHRRDWIEDRIHKQTSAFAVSAYAYAVMSNHVHLVLQVDPGLVATWDDDEVQTRYRSIFTKKPNKNGAVETVAPEDLKKWRERLGSLSWFMRALCEPIARFANEDDGCTGRFWEGRFFSQALLDDRVFLAAMAYADLNPVRAGMALSLERSWHTGIARRLAKLRGEASDVVAAPSVEPPEQSAPTREPRIKPIAGAMCRFGPDISENQYLELVAWSALRHCDGKASLSEPVATLKQLGCSEGEWQDQLDAVKLRWRVIGGSEQVRRLAERIGQQWFCRRRKRRALRRSKPAADPSSSKSAPF